MPFEMWPTIAMVSALNYIVEFHLTEMYGVVNNAYSYLGRKVHSIYSKGKRFYFTRKVEDKDETSTSNLKCFTFESDPKYS